MANPPVPRLKDVAKAANVSLAAASRILRGDHERFGEETCRRVIEASRRLGWRRNLLVSGMQTGRTNTIGIMIPPVGSYWVGVLSGIHDTLAEADYLPITVWTSNLCGMPNFESHETEGIRHINRLLDRRVDGLILWPPFSVAYYHHFPEFVERRVPVAVIDHYSSVVDSVETDEAQATSQVAEHLLNLGHRRIACLSRSETPQHMWAITRRTSFEEAIRRCPDATVKTWHVNPRDSDGPEVARALIASTLQPTAVFAVSDHDAQYVYRAAAELGKSIPRDLSVIGFADLDFAATMNPPLTTVAQNPCEIGRRAARLIVERIDGLIGDDKSPTTVKVPAEFVARASTMAARLS